jgi:membrane protein DedA with SNARE-associated domain
LIRELLLYAAVFTGCLFEGEASLTTSSFAAHRGYLNIFVVMIVALLATQTWDWIWFMIGRRNGKKFLADKPKLLKKANRINRLLFKYQVPVLLGYRFLYGFRTAVPLVLGMSHIKKRKFFFFGIINTLIWDVLFSSVGYFFGAFLKANWRKIEDFEFEIMGVLLLAGILIDLNMRRRANRRIASGT